MSLAIVVSIVIRLTAAAWSVVLLRRLRDWRVLFVTVMLLLMSARQALTLQVMQDADGTRPVARDGGFAAEAPGLVVSVMAFLAVLSLGRMLVASRDEAAALERSETRLRLLAENVDQAFWLVSADGQRLLYVNQAYERISGRSRASLYIDPSSWVRAVHRDDAAAIGLERARRDRSPALTCDGECRVLRPDGTTRWVWIRVHPARDERGEVIGRVGVAVDITRRKEMEEALSFTQFAVDNTSEMALRIEADGRLIYVNESACSRLGRSRDELLSMRISDLDVEVAACRWPMIWHRVKAGGSILAESHFLTRCGKVFPVEISGTYQSFNGRECICVFARDISERQMAETRRKLLMSELDHRVRNNVVALETLIDLTAATSVDVPTFAASMQRRVQAMAGIHELLSGTHWQPVSLERMIQRIMPAGLLGTLRIDGEDLQVPADQGTALAMVLNELMTNSLKHGALGAAGGIVEVAWRIERDGTSQRCALTWSERGGPPVVADPAPGVGTQLIEGLVRSDLRGAVRLAYPPEGAQHGMTLTLDAVETRRETAGTIETAVTASGPRRIRLAA